VLAGLGLGGGVEKIDGENLGGVLVLCSCTEQSVDDGAKRAVMVFDAGR
jgi:hypothetical protein